jgi:hypothetical protein
MFRGYREKGVNALAEAGGILLPEQVVEENAHCVHADAFRPAELQVDALGVEGRRLPHLQFVDGRRGDVVRADEPGLLPIPVVGPLFGPAEG